MYIYTKMYILCKIYVYSMDGRTDGRMYIVCMKHVDRFIKCKIIRVRFSTAAGPAHINLFLKASTS